jgi:peptidoglycan/xylan/chitin deacetylase (PgdA/CDA1 family)
LKRLRIAALALLVSTLPSWSEVWFSGLDLSRSNQLLFRAEADCPGFGPYQTLFAAEVEKNRLRQLTFFPERAVFLAELGVLELQNRYGLFRSDPELKGLQPVPKVPSFVTEAQVESGKLDLELTSPNGRYVLRLHPTSAAYGELVLIDLMAAGQGSVVSNEAELSLTAIPATWSPDSEFLLYHKKGELYYFSVRQAAEKRILSEPYRQIGRGTVRNIRWADAGSLYYLDGSLVYRLDSRELFTRSLYSGYLAIGSLAGKIPFEFDPNFDEFWIAPDGAHILVAKSGRNLFLYPLYKEDYSADKETRSLPYLYLPRSAALKRVLWTRAGTITVLTEGLQKGARRTDLYRLSVDGSSALPVFKRLAEQDLLDLSLSPDGATLAALRPDRVELYAAESWTRKASHAHPQPLHALWARGGALLVAGARFTELWNPASGESRQVAVSQPGPASFSEDEQWILTELAGVLYRQPVGGGAWSKAPSGALRQPVTVTEAYRVYLEEAPNRVLRNRIMLRDVRRLGTRELLPSPVAEYEPFPERDEPVDFELFAHGSRLRRREVSLVFNAVDSIEGLPSILQNLADYKIRATFFVNGEAIRRYPDAMREIAEAGHEVGSLFYTYFNMTDSRFQLDRDFIKRGLGRNEDEYFNATGRELALLWHAPYYFANSELVAAAREMNYVYVSRDLDSLDWVTADVGKAAPDIYFPSAQLVERIVEQKKPGAIVPVLTGRPAGLREDYLFQKIDVLINALLRRGYSVVPISTMIEHAR